MTRRADRDGVGIHRPDVEPAPEEVREIPSTAATGIDQARPPIESAAQKLVEQIDIDPAELRFQFVGHARDIRRHSRIIMRTMTNKPSAIRFLLAIAAYIRRVIKRLANPGTGPFLAGA